MDLKDSDRKGQELLFKEIYDNYYVDLCLYARRFVYDDDEAEEIVQTVIYKMWAQKESLSEIKALKSYLYRAVHNHGLNYVKHQKHKDEYKDKAWVELKQLELDRAEDITNFELKSKVYEAVNSLPDRCREVFELSRFDGLKYKEIAEQLNISVKAVEGNISRALISLRKSLKEYLVVELIVLVVVFSIINIG